MGITWKWSMYLPCYLSFPVGFLSTLSSGMDKGEPQPSYCWDYHKLQVMVSAERGPAVPWTNWMSLLSGRIIHDHAWKCAAFPSQSDTWPGRGWGDRMDWWSGCQVLNIFPCWSNCCCDFVPHLHIPFMAWSEEEVGTASGKHQSTCP